MVAEKDVVAERLRAFVRMHVKPDGARYERGNGARLAEYLKVDHGWVSDYANQAPTSHANLDRSLAICDFYGVKLEAFQRQETPAPQRSRQQDEALRVGSRWLALPVIAQESLMASLEAFEALMRGTSGSAGAPPAGNHEASPGTSHGRYRRRRQG